jgi:hypothetical protein
MFVLLPDIVKVETCECCFLSNQVLAYKVLVIYETRLCFLVLGFGNRAELMKKSNGVYFPEEVSKHNCLVVVFFFFLCFVLTCRFVDDIENCSETLQVVHSTTVSGGISAWQFCSTSGPESKKNYQYLD